VEKSQKMQSLKIKGYTAQRLLSVVAEQIK